MKSVVTASWDWFHDNENDTTKKLLNSGAIGAAISEDGDEDAARRLATEKVTGNVRTAVYDPMIDDFIMVIAWDEDRVEVQPEDGDESGWRGL